MRLKIATQVKASLPQVQAGFTKELFLALNPPFPPVKLLQFDGCKKGDKVALELNFILFKQQWISDITDDQDDGKNWFFIDQGVKLPFFLESWKHHHAVESNELGSLVIDDITFSTGTILLDLLMYPALFLQFLYRKPIYKKRFR